MTVGEKEIAKIDSIQFEKSKQQLSKSESKPSTEKLEVASTQFETSKPLIKLQLKALIACDLWEMNEYYQIMNVDNEALQKALEILQTPGAYEKILK